MNAWCVSLGKPCDFAHRCSRLQKSGVLPPLYGELPDEAMRARMIRHMESIEGFEATLRQPPYPGKDYGGVVRWPFT